MSLRNENLQSLPLAGVRVIEFVHMVMGPTCGLVLADLGADVIKVEPVPEGDNTRRLTGSGAGYWMTYNRNKKSFAVDIKTEEGMAAVRKLIESADVVTENFRPGAMEKLGLGYEQVKAIKPDIIYSSMKGFLPGPYEHRTALDEVVQMMTGLAYMTGPEGRPLRAGASVNDVMGGMFSAISILAALWQRKHTAEGQFVQTGLFENSAFLVGQHMMQMATTGKAAAPMPSRLSAWAIYDVFNTRDDEQVFMGVVSDSQWASFCQAFGFDELGRDPQLAKNTQRVQARAKILPQVKERLAELGKEEVMAMCEKAGLPFSPIQRPQDLFEDPHLNESGGLAHLALENGEQVKVPMLPFEMNGRRFDTRLNVPHLGSHSAELLEEMGYASGDVDALRARGIVR
jgi:crotonobetainyl-CoA:carnitine CoA-transferase CaiB-like acyl-CoA transferase